MSNFHSLIIAGFLLAGLAASQTVKAQTVRGCIADTALNKKMYLCYNPERGGSRYDGDEKHIKVDDKGNFSVSVNNLGKMDFCPAYLVLADGSEWDFSFRKAKPSASLPNAMRKVNSRLTIKVLSLMPPGACATTRRYMRSTTSSLILANSLRLLAGSARVNSKSVIRHSPQLSVRLKTTPCVTS